MAATRALHTDRQEADSPGLQILERLQYPTAQSGKTQEEDPPKASHSGAGVGNSWVTLFPRQADGVDGTENSQTADLEPERKSEGHLKEAELERLLQEERSAVVQAVAAAREQGRREGRDEIEQQALAEQQRLQAQIAECLEQFRLERQSYFHHVEGEVVRLALAIAARVLHRETHLDPLVLSGAVRVALEKLADSSRVVMRVPPREVELWKDFFRTAANLRIQPGILEDPSLSRGECLLVTELGTIELGVRAQLEEIEKGFFDLLDRRPVDAITNVASNARGAV